MKSLIALAILLIASYAECQQKTATTWPVTWSAPFSEVINFPVRGKMTVNGQWYYDYTNKMFRVDRSNGNYDRYCGTIYKFANTPCSQIVRDGNRYMYFPEKNFCCNCCNDAKGCGVVKPEFVKMGEYQGVDKTMTPNGVKYLVKGLQSNYYYETLEGKPLRFYQEPLSDMTWDHSGYNEATIDSKVFDLPANGCDRSCGWVSICSAL